MKITQRIGNVLIAFMLCVTGLIGDGSIVAADTMVNVPNTLNMDINRLVSGTSNYQTIDVTQGYALSDLDNGKVAITYQGGRNTAGNSITLTLPYYYSFDNVLDTSFYTSFKLSNANGGSSNKLVLTMSDAISDKDNPETVSFDFKIKLNRTTIDSVKEENWKKGTWSPNDESTDFKIEHNSNFALTKKLNVVQKDYKAVASLNTNFALRGAFSATHDTNVIATNLYSASSDVTIHKDGGALYSVGESRSIIYATIPYRYPDIYTYSPTSFNDMTYEIKLPAEFEFGDWKPNATAKTIVTSMNISADKKTATLTVNDKYQTGTMDRVISGLEIKPSGDYENGKKYYASESSYPVTMIVKDTKGNEFFSKTQSIKVTKYVDTNGFSITPNGTLDEKTGNKVLDQKNAGDTIQISNIASIANTRSASNPINEINSDGKDVTVIQSYDANLRITQVDLANTKTNLGWFTSYLSGNVWKSYSFSTNKRSNVTGALNDTDTTKTIKLTDKDEYITSVSITYDKFMYSKDVSIFQKIVGKLTDKNETNGKEWKPGEDIPIETSIKNVGGVELANGKNYVRIKDLECPPLHVGTTNYNKTSLDSGEYSDGKTIISSAVYLNTPYIGTPTYVDGKVSAVQATYLDVLENPVFTVGGSYKGGFIGGADTVAQTIATNGKVNLAAIMGDGKWSVLIKTQSALGAKNNRALKEYTITLPSFSTITQVDLTKLANIPNDEYIVWFQMSHAGDLNIKSLSNHYTDANPTIGEAVDKMFFTVEASNYNISPLSGQYYSEIDKTIYTHVSYDNCQDTNGQHLPTKDGRVILDTDIAVSNKTKATYKSKGAETFTPQWNSKYDFNMDVQQGRNSTMNIQYIPIGGVSSNEYKLLSTGGEVFYFQLDSDAQKYFSFAQTATVDGMKANAEIVLLKGNQYLKITNPKRKQYEKTKLTSGLMNVTFEAYDINIEVFASTITPTKRNLNIFTRTYAPNNNYGTFIDWRDASYQEYEQNGKVIRNALILGQQDNLGTGVSGGTAFATNSYLNYDDWAGLYSGADVLDRHYLTIFNSGYSKIASLQAFQGVVLNPGVDGNYSEAIKQVQPWDRGKLTTALTLIAGQSEPMQDLKSTIALPRKGVEVDDGGTKYTSDVSLYLTGPIALNIDFGIPTSTKPIFQYSIDGGKTFVDETKITDWKKVTHCSIYVKNIAVGDGSTFTIGLETDDNDFELGKAYMPALFETSNLSAQSNRLNVYDFIGYTISGTAWEDTNKDGMIASSEAKLDTTMNLYQNYGEADEKVIASTNTDATTGEYSFHNVKEINNLTLVSELPSKKTVTVLNATTDNKFTRTETGYAQYIFGNINKQQVEINYGIRDLIEVTIGGTDTTTAITGLKTLSGSLKNTDIVKDQYIFNVDADSNNPINGTEGIPTTIKNDVGTSKGAALSFTGIDGWTFTKEGIYQFTLTEADPSLKGHIYDQSTYEVKITVTEKTQNGNPTGELQQLTEITKESGSIAIDALNFENIAKAYQVNYDTGGGQPALIPSKTNVNWNDKNLLPSSIPTKTGYTFAGWEVRTTTKSLSDITNEDTYAVLAQDDDTKAEVTFKAKWTKKEYQVSWISEDTTHGTLTPATAKENVKYEEFATTDITITPNTTSDKWVFTGWEYNYLPDGQADVPANYITGVTQDYKTIEVKGNIVFTAKFSKKTFVNVDSEQGYVAIKDGTTLPVIPENIADKKTTAKIEYDERNTNAKKVAIAFESKRHYHLEKATVSDLYGNEKIIYTNIKGESADTTFTMNDSELTIDFSETGSLKIENIKNSLHVRFTFKEDPKYAVDFYTQSKADVNDTTKPYASNEGLYSGDEYGIEPAVTPVKEGYSFSGWGSEGTEVNYKATDTIADANVKFYAVWNQKSYTVKYNLNGGYHNIATTIPDYTTSFTGTGLLPINEPRKDGYAFDGWYHNGNKISNTMSYKELVADDTVSSITLSAKWIGNKYQVEFDKNSEKATGSMASQGFTYGEKQPLSSNTFTRVGYTFAGWSTSAEGTVVYTDGQEVENLTEEKDGTVKLYALWNASGDTAYTIEHYKQQNDGTWKNNPDDVVNMSGLSDSDVNAIIKSSGDSGYENAIFDEGNTENILKGVIEADGSLVLKVYYKQVLTVSFDVDGGTPSIADQRLVYGEKAMKVSDPVKAGYEFIGWKNVESKKNWDFDEEVTSNMTLKAEWKKINKPEEPTKPSDPSKPNQPEQGETPKTGDTSAVNSMLLLFGTSLVLGFIAIKKRKEQKD